MGDEYVKIGLIKILYNNKEHSYLRGIRLFMSGYGQLNII